MGTVFCFDVVCGDESELRELHLALARCRTLLQRVDAVFSLWRPHSPMSLLRAGTSIAAPPEMAEVASLCQHAREITDGWFDPWALPGGFDPTGLVKGWATARALTCLTDAGFGHVMVNGAGDIACAGGSPAGSPWRVGIQDPRSARSLVAVVELQSCVATSGDYARGAHLYDPRHACYQAGSASVSVVGADLALCDAFATALCVAGPVGLELIERSEGYEAFMIGFDDSRHSTTGFHAVPPPPSLALAR